MSTPVFNPEHQWGNWGYIPPPDASVSEIAAERQRLAAAMQQFLPEVLWGEVVWLVKPRSYHPKMGEVTTVAWKWTPKKL